MTMTKLAGEITYQPSTTLHPDCLKACTWNISSTMSLKIPGTINFQVKVDEESSAKISCEDALLLSKGSDGLKHMKCGGWLTESRFALQGPDATITTFVKGRALKKLSLYYLYNEFKQNES